MADEVIYELGVDINSSFTFNDGDIVLASYDENLVQSISNRLNTDLDEMDLFYEEYGSIFTNFYGWKGNDETLSFMKSELETVLKDEPRLVSWDFDIRYVGDGRVRIDLRLYPAPDYVVEASLQLTENGVEVVE